MPAERLGAVVEVRCVEVVRPFSSVERIVVRVAPEELTLVVTVVLGVRVAEDDAEDDELRPEEAGVEVVVEVLRPEDAGVEVVVEVLRPEDVDVAGVRVVAPEAEAA